MKIKLLFLGVLTLLFLLKPQHASCQTPLYFNIISHSEVTDTFDYENSNMEYNLVKNIAKELCDTYQNMPSMI